MNTTRGSPATNTHTAYDLWITIICLFRHSPETRPRQLLRQGGGGISHFCPLSGRRPGEKSGFQFSEVRRLLRAISLDYNYRLNAVSSDRFWRDFFFRSFLSLLGDPLERVL